MKLLITISQNALKTDEMKQKYQEKDINPKKKMQQTTDDIRLG